MSGTQKRIVEMLRAGKRLMWFGDNGPEMEGVPFWPQKRTVRAMIRDGVLMWGEPLNEMHKTCGIYPVVLTAVDAPPAPHPRG